MKRHNYSHKLTVNSILCQLVKTNARNNVLC